MTAPRPRSTFTRTCQWCDAEFTGRSDAIYCCGAHRFAAHRAANDRTPPTPADAQVLFNRVRSLRDRVVFVHPDQVTPLLEAVERLAAEANELTTALATVEAARATTGPDTRP